MPRSLGKHQIGISQRSGRKVRARDLVMDGENKGLIVDRREADPEHPQKYARVIPQDRPLIYPNIPEPAETAAANLPSGWSASDADALWSARTYVTR